MKSNKEITTEDVKKLKAQSLRTKSFVEEWQELFEPFKSSFKHKALDNLRQTCITLFATGETPGRLLLKRILPHQWLKPSSRSVSKELIDARQNTKNPLVPWGRIDRDRSVIFLGPNKTIKIERKLELLPCKTDEEAQKALAWLAVALSTASRNPLVLGGKWFPLEYEHAHAAFKKPSSWK